MTQNASPSRKNQYSDPVAAARSGDEPMVTTVWPARSGGNGTGRADSRSAAALQEAIERLRRLETRLVAIEVERDLLRLVADPYLITQLRPDLRKRLERARL
jgi:hypothetical protein